MAAATALYTAASSGKAEPAKPVDSDTFTTLINLAGRQRMLSKRIVLNAILAAQGDEQAKTIALQSLALFEASHKDLVQGNAALPGVFFNALHNIYFGENNADIRIREFIDQAQHALHSQPASAGLVKQLGLAATPMVELLNHVTQVYETEARQHTHTQRKQYTSLMNDIQRIAKQAKIVSVNAQIMAARAGEAGKEFSVVAGVLTSITGEMAHLIATAMRNGQH